MCLCLWPCNGMVCVLYKAQSPRKQGALQLNKRHSRALASIRHQHVQSIKLPSCACVEWPLSRLHTPGYMTTYIIHSYASCTCA